MPLPTEHINFTRADSDRLVRIESSLQAILANQASHQQKCDTHEADYQAFKTETTNWKNRALGAVTVLQLFLTAIFTMVGMWIKAKFFPG